MGATAWRRTIVDALARRRTIVDALARPSLWIAFRAARLAWRVRRPCHHGALVAVLVGGRLLLVRQSYRPERSLPGGGVRRDETPRDAARRELEEELGLAVAPESLSHCLTASGLWDFRRDRVDIYELRIAAPPALHLDGREIVGVEYVDPDDPKATARFSLTGPTRAYLEWRDAADARRDGAVAGG